MLKLRTKIEAISLVSLLVILSFSSAWAVTRNIQSNKETISGGTYFLNGNYDWINNSHFNLSNKITNSKGHIYNATGINLQLAIDDLIGSWGTVNLGANITTTTTIQMRGGVTLDLKNHKITPTGNYNVILLKPNSIIQNGIINTTGLLTNTSACIFIDGADHYGLAQNTQIKNMVLLGKTTSPRTRTGNGIYFYCDAINEYICYVKCNNIQTMYLGYGIRMNQANALGSSYMNANAVDTFLDEYTCYPIYLSSENITTVSINANSFSDFNLEAGHGVYTINCVTIMGTANRFIGTCWDVDYPSQISFNITNRSHRTYIIVYESNAVVDNGHSTMIFTLYNSRLHVPVVLGNDDGPLFIGSNDTESLFLNSWYYGKSGNISLFDGIPFGTYRILKLYGNDSTQKYLYIFVGADGSSYIDGQSGENMFIQSGDKLYLNGNADDAIYCYYNAGNGENQPLRVYGRNSTNTANQYIRMQWGDATNNYGIVNSSYGGVRVDDLILKTNAPRYPVAGSVWFNATTSVLMIYDGSVWRHSHFE